MIAAIYAAAAGLMPPSRPLEILVEATRSDRAFVAHFDLEKRNGKILSSFNIEPNFIESYDRIYAAQNPWLARGSYFQAEGLVWRGNEIVDLDSITDTDFFRLFMCGQAIENTAHAVIRVRGNELHHLMLTRRPRAEDYHEASLENCRIFAYHARHALNVGGAVMEALLAGEGYSAALDGLGIGIAVIELPGNVLRMTPTCAKLLGLRRPHAAIAGSRRGAPFSGSEARKLQDLPLPRPLVDAIGQRPIPTSCVIHSSPDAGARPVAVELRPTRMRPGVGLQATDGLILVCRKCETEFDVDDTALRSAFYLTFSEARVCQALIRGDSILALSRRLSISPQTARTHLKRIFDKTGTSRQPELMRLLMSFAIKKSASVGLELESSEAGKAWMPR